MKELKFAPEQEIERSGGPVQAEIIDEKRVSPLNPSFAEDRLLITEEIGKSDDSFSKLFDRDTGGLNGNGTRHLVSTPSGFTPSTKFKVLNRWEGVITEVFNGDCRAVVTNLSTSGTPREEIVFSLQEISPSDLSLVAPGAVFYWAIGYEDSLQGQRTRKSVIRLQRLPSWTERELSKAQQEALSLKELFSDR